MAHLPLAVEMLKVDADDLEARIYESTSYPEKCCAS